MVQRVRMWAVGVLAAATLAAGLTSAAAGASDAPTVVRINAGGPGVAGSPSWESDSPAAPHPAGNGSEVGADQITATTKPIDLSHPSVPAGTPAAVFADARADWSTTAPDLTYTLPTDPGDHLLRLYFAELNADYAVAGGRVFDVFVEGQLLRPRFDIAVVSGGLRRGVVVEQRLTTGDDDVEVRLRSVRRPPIIAGLELVRLAPEPPLARVPLDRINAGGPAIAGTPTWAADSPTHPHPRSTTRLVGPEQVTTAKNAVDRSSGTLPTDLPAAVLVDARADWAPGVRPDVTYLLEVPAPGQYVVRLYFVEHNPSFVGTSSRIVDVSIDEVLRDNDLDIARTAGGPNRAFAREYVVDSDGLAVTVRLRGVRKPPSVAALEVLGAPVPPVDRPGQWQLVDLPLTPHTGEAAWVTHDGWLYRIGGQYVGRDLIFRSVPTFERVHLATRTWEALPPLPVPVDHVEAVVHDGRIWIVGGTTTGTEPGDDRPVSGQVLSFDPASGQLTRHPDMPRPRGAGAVTVVGDRLYYFGGVVAGGPTTAMVDRLDLTTGAWSQLAPMPLAKDHFRAVAIDGLIHLVGGRQGNAATSMARHDVFDPVDKTWTMAAEPPDRRSGYAAVAVDGRLMVIGGELRNPDVALRGVVASDPADGAWTEWESMHDGRHGVDAVNCAGDVVVAGGSGAFGGMNEVTTVEVFTPDGAEPTCPLVRGSGEAARSTRDHDH